MLQSIISQNELSLDLVIKLLSQQHDDQTSLKLTRDDLLRATSEDIKRKGMEFLDINEFYDDLETLIDYNLTSNNPLTREWANAYQLIIDHRLKRLPQTQLLQKIINFHTKELELQ